MHTLHTLTYTSTHIHAHTHIHIHKENTHTHIHTPYVFGPLLPLVREADPLQHLYSAKEATLKVGKLFGECLLRDGRPLN